MNILYVSSGDPNSHGNVLKYYWEKLNLGKFWQISKARPSGKPVDIQLIVDDENTVKCGVYKNKTLGRDELRKLIGNLYRECDVLHFDRPTLASIKRTHKAFYFSPSCKKGVIKSWKSLIPKKPVVFNYRGSRLLRWRERISKLFKIYPHAVPVYCNPHLRFYLPSYGMMLPFCGNEKVWSQVESSFPDDFTIVHPTSSDKVTPNWLKFNLDVLKHIENKDDFLYGVDSIGALKVLQNKGMDIKITELTGVSWLEALDIIANATCLFHNFKAHGSYGWSAVEGMYFGKPILNGVSTTFPFEFSPFLQTENEKQLLKNVKLLYNNSDEIEKYSKKSKKFYKKYHAPKVVVECLLSIYNEAIRRFENVKK